METKIGYKVVRAYNKKLYSFIRYFKSNSCYAYTENKGFPDGQNYYVRYIKNKWVTANKRSRNKDLFVFDQLNDVYEFLNGEYGSFIPDTLRIYKCKYVQSATFSLPYGFPEDSKMAEKVKLIKRVL